ncbi:hypothetical protein BJY52DRAFT_1195618 [Lactarius psammicola]|nr:hypothetical protein BJY52DRAFT_1195618 [Lactarius psammicola]
MFTVWHVNTIRYYTFDLAFPYINTWLVYHVHLNDCFSARFLSAFDLSFTPRAGVREDVAVELYISFMNGRDVQRHVSVRSRATHAALVYCLLRLRNLPSHPFRLGAGPTPTLRGTFASGNAHPRLARGVDLVRAARPLLGTLKIDQLKLSEETYKPYKGVRGRALRPVWRRVEWERR